MQKKEFAKRRQHLMDIMGPDTIAVLPNAPVANRNRDVDYPYRSDSNFHYLTGFDEPESVLVLIPGREHGEYILFCRERDLDKEIWDGYRAGQDGAINNFGADDSYPISDLDDILPGLLEDKEKVYYTMGNQPSFDQHMVSWLNHLRQASRSGKHSPTEIIELEHCLNELRLFKSSQEIKAMKQAAKASVQAHIRAMQFTKPGKWEYEVEAEIIHEFMKHGCRSPAYPSIVGGGENGCILHYIENNAKLKNNDLLLIDAGAEYECYAGDITRTFPVNGKFSPAQAALYQVVLDAQKAAIAAVKPGNHWNQPHEVAVEVLTQGLVDLGILKGDVAQLIEDAAYREFYMHRTGHWLGMDVHDVGDYKVGGEWRLLEPGMVLTVEPGLYIRDQAHVDKKWHFTGIRIEDDVLVTKDGCEVLTEAAPKEIDEIEALMAEAI
ncbi:MAG: Xaa-Pro aminopeptidase [Pseudomonadota bacterium]|jgi:Xaa-Pro aminopeptidase|uniref:Xaa-Pro aminopeptidase n=1 Tax=Methylophaga aminisulfidivorans MP TaxID=1026882 RepID=F5T307_9GAMM|nr:MULTISPECIES: Xaa-Pro aminopeptidase [Methylophaga]EGL53365.1 xaa-Pro aminopeptidase [Methylophaga aminisulfidivorans MP]MEC9412942.1 Xaa-Pro aminopeptidase [Pseudomonadota bacterium]WVI84776.1 Xaa-Pro aminopeptidase [Methylophaga thalassica]